MFYSLVFNEVFTYLKRHHASAFPPKCAEYIERSSKETLLPNVVRIQPMLKWIT